MRHPHPLSTVMRYDNQKKSLPPSHDGPVPVTNFGPGKGGEAGTSPQRRNPRYTSQVTHTPLFLAVGKTFRSHFILRNDVSAISLTQNKRWVEPITEERCLYFCVFFCRIFWRNQISILIDLVQLLHFRKHLDL